MEEEDKLVKSGHKRLVFPEEFFRLHATGKMYRLRVLLVRHCFPGLEKLTLLTLLVHD